MNDAPGRTPASMDSPPTPWHALSAEQALRALGADRNGLSHEEAERRLAEMGANRLPAAMPRSELRRFLAQFNNVLIYVLLASAAITLVLGHATDAAVVLAVVVANAVIGFIQEGRAERALDAIKDMLAPRASVIRSGRRVTVEAERLVPGDLVLLEAGDRVPADLRLLRSGNLRMEEAALTGESVPVDKSPEAVPAEAALGDRTSMAFSGTMVASGSATGLAVATGPATEIGRISGLIGAVEALTTPLLRQMNAFARLLTAVILGVAAAVFGFAVLVRAYPIDEAFLAMIGIAVAAIPEGLPAILTITLAIGVQRMARRNAIIRRLPAVETLGSVSIICTDKTGTLPRNEMTMRTVAAAGELVAVGGVGYEPHGGFTLGGRDRLAEDLPVLVELARAGMAPTRRRRAPWRSTRWSRHRASAGRLHMGSRRRRQPGAGNPPASRSRGGRGRPRRCGGAPEWHRAAHRVRHRQITARNRRLHPLAAHRLRGRDFRRRGRGDARDLLLPVGLRGGGSG
jgi:magnesium-transporting ATPase (P-type)